MVSHSVDHTRATTLSCPSSHGNYTTKLTTLTLSPKLHPTSSATLPATVVAATRRGYIKDFGLAYRMKLQPLISLKIHKPVCMLSFCLQLPILLPLDTVVALYHQLINIIVRGMCN